MIMKISGIQIFTEIEISDFEKVVYFLKNRIKNWKHPKFCWYKKHKRRKKIKNIRTSQSQTAGVKPWLTWYGHTCII
jgi:hypothetical protein